MPTRISTCRLDLSDNLSTNSKGTRSMPNADPQEMQSQIEVTNLKAMGELTTQLVAAFNAITIGASENYSATMDALNKQMVNNLDFANKIMNTRLEVDPVEAASTAILLQQATKTAQTTPPVTA